jgi:hypothetical protein
MMACPKKSSVSLVNFDITLDLKSSSSSLRCNGNN